MTYEIMISPGFLSGLLMGLEFPGLCSCCFHPLPVGICIRGTDALLRFIQHTESGVFCCQDRGSRYRQQFFLCEADHFCLRYSAALPVAEWAVFLPGFTPAENS